MKHKQMTHPTLLILAAGLGSRYGGLKQIEPMGPNGETMLDYSIFDAIRAGFDRVVFVIREDFAELFQRQVGRRFVNRIKVEYAFQKMDDLPRGFTCPLVRTKPWGTGHAIYAARDLLQSSSFVVINADDFYGAGAYEQAARFLADETRAIRHALVSYPLQNTLTEHGEVNRGICRGDASGLLKSVEEYLKIQRDEDGKIRGNSGNGTRQEISETTPVSMNLWAFSPEILQFLEEDFYAFLQARGKEEKAEYYIPWLVDSFIHLGKGSCALLTTTCQWFGVTYPQDKPTVVSAINALVDNGAYPSPLL